MSKKQEAFQAPSDSLTSTSHDPKARFAAANAILGGKLASNSKGSAAIGLNAQLSKRSIAQVISTAVSAKNTTLNFDLSREIVITEKFDPMSRECVAAGAEHYLERALSNILDNAVEATPIKQPVTIHIRATCENGEVSIAVSDTGIGIPEPIIGLIGRTPMSHCKEGSSGRGLYFVHRFLQSIDGTLEISNIQSGSRKGGARVVMRLPLLH